MRSRFLYFAEYMAAVSAILAMSANNKVFLLAPPYAVSAYLVLFERNTKFSKPSGLAVSYGFAIASSEALHALLGPSIASMTINVFAVSAFIMLTEYSHPPAIALTIFSYLRFSDVLFVTSSLAALGIIILIYAIDSALIRAGKLSRV
ncbi:HPP family protein [Thermocladium modestius]|uniref:HPP family protein n=1 Tax=Thermocladium modestius TaxID=62609 RepID=UPI00166F4248|nr:HPP family protein [Thermocladium modestius]